MVPFQSWHYHQQHLINVATIYLIFGICFASFNVSNRHGAGFHGATRPEDLVRICIGSSKCDFTVSLRGSTTLAVFNVVNHLKPHQASSVVMCKEAKSMLGNAVFRLNIIYFFAGNTGPDRSIVGSDQTDVFEFQLLLVV